jgi:hypothetical protein
MPLSPKDFKKAIQIDVWMIDQIGKKHRTDPSTGLEIGPESDPELTYMMTGCVWNSQYVTLVEKGEKGESSDTLALEQFALAATLIPAGKDMRYETNSDWLIEQWNEMMRWKECGYLGLDRDACMPQWAGIMKYIEEGPRGVQMVKFEVNGTDSAIVEATQLYAIEGLQRLEEERERMVDACRQPEAPWS